MYTVKIFTSNFLQEDPHMDHTEETEVLCLTLDEGGVRTFDLSA